MHDRAYKSSPDIQDAYVFTKYQKSNSLLSPRTYFTFFFLLAFTLLPKQSQ